MTYAQEFSGGLARETRRHFLQRCPAGIGAAALAMLSGNAPSVLGKTVANERPTAAGGHFPARAKNVIFLHMAGAPSQLELFDYKPALSRMDRQPCPESFLDGKRFAFIEGVPNMLGPQTRFKQYGDSGAWVSDRLPHFRDVVDDVCFVKSISTDEFNHAPAQLLMYTGFARQSRPSMGSWVTYGLGSENSDLPGFIVLLSGARGPSAGKSVWGSGFIPSVFQGVQCRSKGEPILYVNSPDWMDRKLRRQTIDWINELNRQQWAEQHDPETLTRIAQYELAFKMQLSVPELTDLTSEPEYIHRLYGTELGKESFANNCLLARRLVERGVRFVQLFDWGWDSHGNGEEQDLNIGFVDKCNDIDQAMTALIIDLKQRGLLDETLVVWGGEFGRTPMRDNGKQNLKNLGRDHHKEAFTIWLAGGGIQPGISFGATDEFGYYPVEHQVHIHDLQATILNQLGLDHERLTYHFQGRDHRLTDVHGHVIREILT